MKPSNRQDRSIVVRSALGEDSVNDVRKKIIYRLSFDRGRFAQSLHAGFE